MSQQERFWAAIACYAVLATIAFFVLDGPLLGAVSALFLALAAKTWIHIYRRD